MPCSEVVEVSSGHGSPMIYPGATAVGDEVDKFREGGGMAEQAQQREAGNTDKDVEIPFHPNKGLGHRAARVEPGSPRERQRRSLRDTSKKWSLAAPGDCVYVLSQVPMCMCVFMHMYLLEHMCACAYIYVFTYTYLYARKNTCLYTRPCPFTFICMHMCML